jgi:hypothetical protein
MLDRTLFVEIGLEVHEHNFKRHKEVQLADFSLVSMY